MALPRPSASTRSFFRRHAGLSADTPGSPRSSRARGGASNDSRSSVFSISTVSDSDPFSASVAPPEAYPSIHHSAAVAASPRGSRTPVTTPAQQIRPSAETPRINLISPSASVHYLFESELDTPTPVRPLSKIHHRLPPQSPVRHAVSPGLSSASDSTLASPPDTVDPPFDRSTLQQGAGVPLYGHRTFNEMSSSTELGYLRPSISMQSLRRKTNFVDRPVQVKEGWRFRPVKQEPRVGAKGLKRMDSLVVAERRAKRDGGQWRMPPSASKLQVTAQENGTMNAPPTGQQSGHALRPRSSTVGAQIILPSLSSAKSEAVPDYGRPALAESHDRTPSFSHIDFYPTSVPMTRSSRVSVAPVFPKRKHQSLAAARSVPMIRDYGRLQNRSHPFEPSRVVQSRSAQIERRDAIDDTRRQLESGRQPASVPMRRDNFNIAGHGLSSLKKSNDRDREQGVEAHAIGRSEPSASHAGVALRRSKSEQRLSPSQSGPHVNRNEPYWHYDVLLSDRGIHLGDPSIDMGGRYASVPRPSTQTGHMPASVPMAREVRVLDTFDSVNFTRNWRTDGKARIYNKSARLSLHSDISLLAPSTLTRGASSKSVTTLPQSLLDELVDLTNPSPRHRKEESFASVYTVNEWGQGGQTLQVEIGQRTTPPTSELARNVSTEPWTDAAARLGSEAGIGLAVTSDQAKPTTMARLKCKASSDLGSVTGSLKGIFRREGTLGRSLSQMLDARPGRKKVQQQLSPVHEVQSVVPSSVDQQRREKLLTQAVSMSLSKSARQERTSSNAASYTISAEVHPQSLRSIGMPVVSPIMEEVVNGEMLDQALNLPRVGGRLRSKSVGKLLDEVQRRASIFSGASVYSSEMPPAEESGGLTSIVQRLRSEQALPPWPDTSAAPTGNVAQRTDQIAASSTPGMATAKSGTGQPKSRPRSRSLGLKALTSRSPISSADALDSFSVLDQLSALELSERAPPDEKAEGKARKVKAWLREVNQQKHLNTLERKMEQHIEHEKGTMSKMCGKRMSAKEFGSSYA